MFNNSYIRFILAGFLLFFLIIVSKAQQSNRIPSERPELIIALVVDQMRPDQIHRLWDKFGEGGFKKLINNGTVIQQAGYHYFNTQGPPGYATISSGTQPSDHGIVSTDWYELLGEEMVRSTEDLSVNPVGGSFINGLFSPDNLMVSTLGDELKLSNQSRSKVFGVGLNNEGAILSSGHSADAAFWFDESTGGWMTSTYYMDSLPLWLNKFNQKMLPDIYLDRTWEPLLPLNEYTESMPDSLLNKEGLFGQVTFPYDLKKLGGKRNRRRDYSLMKYTPYGVTFTMDMALTLIIEEELGKDNYPDYLALNLSAFGPVSEKFGLESVEFEDVLLRLDRELAHFLKSIEELLDKNRVLIFFTATHGMHKESEYLRKMKLPTGQFDRNQALSLLKSYLNVKFGSGNWIKGYYGNQIYFNRVLIEDSKISLQEIRDQVANFMVQFTAVAHAITTSTFSYANFSDNLNSLVRNGYNPKRSGDITVVLRSGWRLEGEGRTSTGYNYDRRVPMIWYGWKIGKNIIYRDIDITDIAPTLSLFLNIPLPDACSGKPILELLK